MASFTVRPAALADVPAIANVQVRTWRDAYRGQMPDRVLAELDITENAGRRVRTMSDPGYPGRLLVAVDHPAGAVIGFTEFGPGRIDEDWQRLTEDEAEVYAIYVAPEHSGRGAGRALMDAAIAELTRDGPRPVRLWVLRTNERARRFYERYGFVLDGSTSTFHIQRANEPPVDLDEVRYVFNRTA